MENKRKLHLEVLRILAAFFVIFNHTHGFTLFMNHVPESISYWVFLAFSVVSKISVPLFFMISGALLLGKEESTKRLLLRVLRIVIALVAFSLLSYVQQIRQGNEQLNVGRFFQVLVQSDWLNVYWYLYAYLAFLLCLPFLRAMAKTLREGHYVYLICLNVLIHGVIPVIFNIVFGWNFSYNGHISFGWLLGNVPLYPLVGYYLEHKVHRAQIRWWKLCLLWLASVVCVALSCYGTYCDNMASGGFTQNYMMSFVIVLCITLYLTGKKLLDGCNIVWLSKVLTCVGSCTFGIYLFHGQLLRAPRIRLLQFLYSSGILHPMLHHVFTCLDIMIIGFGVTWLLKKIPFVKNIL